MQGISKYSAENIATLEKVVVRRFGISRGELHSPGRVGSTARFVMFYILSEHFMYSSPQIGRMYNRDHSTVLAGIHKIRSNQAIIEQSDKILSECLGTSNNSVDKDVYSDRYNKGITLGQVEVPESYPTVVPPAVPVSSRKKRISKPKK